MLLLLERLQGLRQSIPKKQMVVVTQCSPRWTYTTPDEGQAFTVNGLALLILPAGPSLLCPTYGWCAEGRTVASDLTLTFLALSPRLGTEMNRRGGHPSCTLVLLWRVAPPVVGRAVCPALCHMSSLVFLIFQKKKKKSAEKVQRPGL
jgi:hypothetical protein